jgi:hypothetical protein
MLTIRTAQLQTLSQLAFERGAQGHVARYFPRHVAAMGPEATLQAVRAAHETAARLGFREEREISHFIDLSFMFGPDFHANPLHAWAAGILADRAITDPRHRMARLYEAALGHLRRLAAASEAVQGV